MTKYQLAKLIIMAGGIKSRKRLQKTVHLLQAAGCPLEVSDFRIHYYGPYSKSLAGLVGEMTHSGLLTESGTESEFGQQQYNYVFSTSASESLEAFEATEKGTERRKAIEGHEDLLNKLCVTPPRILELASTIVEFRKSGQTWQKAIDETVEFKKDSEDSNNMEEAKTLAETVLR